MWELQMEAFPWLPIWALTLGMGNFEMSQTFGSRFWGPNLAQIKPSWNCWKVLEEYYNKVGLHSQNKNTVKWKSWEPNFQKDSQPFNWCFEETNQF